MDTRTRKLAAWVIVAVGVVVAVVGVFADSLGLGGEGANDFGTKQVAALVAGIVIAVVGLAGVFWPLGGRKPA